MHTALTLAAVLLLAGSAGARQREPPPTKPPSKGDTIIARGCLSGSALEASETRVVDRRDPSLASAVTFRLTGDKNRLKQMRKDHDGQIVEVTGVLKSELPRDDARRGVQVGKTRITVGVGQPHTTTPQPQQYIPVLEVKSYESLGTICAG